MFHRAHCAHFLLIESLRTTSEECFETWWLAKDVQLDFYFFLSKFIDSKVFHSNEGLQTFTSLLMFQNSQSWIKLKSNFYKCIQ